MDRLHQGVMLLSEGSLLETYDLYWIAYAGGRLSCNKRKELKAIGWRLQRHSRTNEEIWVLDNEEAIRKYQEGQEGLII